MKIQKLSLILALLFAMIGATLIGKRIKSYEKLMNKSYGPTLVVLASRSVKKGEAITEAHIKAQDIPHKLVTDDMFTQENFTSLFGSIALKEIREGEIILKGYISDGSPSAKKGKNERLVPLDENLARLASPFSNGDRIDVILTYKSAQGSVTKTVLQDIGVKKSESPAVLASEEQTPASAVFLSMSSYESKVFNHIMDRGRIAFVLRNSEDTEKTQPLVDDSVIYGSKTSSLEVISSTF